MAGRLRAAALPANEKLRLLGVSHHLVHSGAGEPFCQPFCLFCHRHTHIELR